MLRKTNGSSSFRTTKLRSFVSTGSSTGVYLKKKKKKRHQPWPAQILYHEFANIRGTKLS